MRSTYSRRLIAAAGAITLAVSVAACGSGRTDNATSSAATTPTTPAAAASGSAGSSTPAGSGAAASSVAPSGSSSSSAATTPTGPAIKIGTTDQVVSLDPAGSYDNGSLMLETQLYQFLLVIPAGQTAPTPDAASKCAFTDKGTTYTCTMKSGLKFSNGDPLTAKDVEFTFNRVIKINDPNGPASLLANMKSVKATDDTTVVFTLNTPNDQTFPFILGTSAGPIVDSKVFPADKLLEDSKVIGSGEYKLGSGYQKNQLAALEPNANYQGNGGAIVNSGVTLQYFTDASNLKLAVQQGTVDVAWRSLDAQSISDLRKDSKVKVLDGPGGELRYMVFNLNTMPGGTAAQKLAVRRAIAFSVDRQALATDIYQDTYTPVYSMIPDGLPGHVDAFKTEFGATPDKTKAAAALTAAGVTTPVTVNLQYALGHYGPTSADEYGEIKRQLEATGLFKVNLQSTEWTTYSKERRADAYPVYQLGWFPDFPDADNYISPFLVPNNFVGAHYCDDPKTVKTATVGTRPCDTDKVLPLIATEQSQTGAARTTAIEKIQTIGATGELPTLPLLQGKQIAVTGTNVTGVDKTLDSTFQFRFWLIGKSS